MPGHINDASHKAAICQRLGVLHDEVAVLAADHPGSSHELHGKPDDRLRSPQLAVLEPRSPPGRPKILPLLRIARVAPPQSCHEKARPWLGMAI